MALKHTPGPWHLEPLDGKFYGAHVSVGDQSITVWTPNYNRFRPSAREIANGWEAERGYDHVEDEQTCANATLIAAAPDMLQLLRDALDSYMADPNPDALGNTMRRVEDLLWRLDGNE